MGPSLTGTGFLLQWGGVSVGVLFDRMRMSMPQDDPNGLSGREYADVLAYVFQENQFPPGMEELPEDGAGLDEVQIEAEHSQSRETG